MKKIISEAGVLLVAGLAVLSAAMPARAETLMRVNIPFEFLAGERIHPAGDYFVLVNSDYRFVELRPSKSAHAEWVALNGRYVPRQGVDPMKGFLRFERYGSTYAMRAVGIPNAEAGMAVKPSKIEKELAKSNGGAGAEVSLTQ
jgi:hypothetical protein